MHNTTAATAAAHLFTVHCTFTVVNVFSILCCLFILEQVYEDRVAYLNGMMVKTHAIKPVGKAFSFAKIGSLPEDNAFASEEQRRNAVIRKLKAEEVRSKLKVRIPFSNK